MKYLLLSSLFCSFLFSCDSYRLYINRDTNPYGKKYYDDLQKRKQITKILEEDIRCLIIILNKN